MKIFVQTPAGEKLEFDVDATDPLATLKCLIESVKPELGPADSIKLNLKGDALMDDSASLSDVRCQDGDVLLVSGGEASVGTESAVEAGGKGVGKGADRPGCVPAAGFHAVKVIVSQCSNELTNGVFLPAKPYAGKPVWHKTPSSEVAASSPDVAAEGTEPQSKDRGERFIYYSERAEKWFVGDALEEGGFTFVLSPGKSGMPPLEGWHGGAIINFESISTEGTLNVPAALKELVNLSKVDPWADQETCYVTMMKVLGNIATNPTEPKFFSIKIENAAIQNKILRHNGARGFLEAVGFCEKEGALALPMENSANAKMAQDVLQGFATDCQYAAIRKERHAKAAEEVKKEAERKKYERPAQKQGYGDSQGGGGSRGGPMRGGGGG